jgi:hypothetical protein
MENMSGGGTQTGVWCNGTQFTATGAAWYTGQLAGTVLPASDTPVWSLVSGSDATYGSAVTLNGDGTISLSYPAKTAQYQAACPFYLWQCATAWGGNNTTGSEYEVRFKVANKSYAPVEFSIFDGTKYMIIQACESRLDNSKIVIRVHSDTTGLNYAELAQINAGQFYVLKVALKGNRVYMTLDGALIRDSTPLAGTISAHAQMGYEVDYHNAGTLTFPSATAIIDYWRWKTNGSIMI